MKRKFFLNSGGALLSSIALAFLLSATQSQAAVGDVFTDNKLKYTVLSEKGATGTVSVGQRTDVILPGVLEIPGSVYDYHHFVTYTVTEIAEGAFYNRPELGVVTIPASVTILGKGAFYDCVSMTSVTIPEGVTRFGDWVFANCHNLTSIAIPDSVIEMGDYPFYDCRSLAEIVVGNNNPIFSSLDGVLFTKDRTTLLQCPGGKGGAYTVPDSVTRIADYAFEKCGWLTKVVIPDSVTSIGVDVFYGCFTLEEIVAGSNNPIFSSLDGVLFTKDRTALLLCPEGKNGDYTVPGSVATIADYAFSNCEFLTGVVIGDSVTEIGGHAFYYCSSLMNVVIGNGVTKIGAYAFSDCISLMNLAIGNNVTEIGAYAFTVCYSLRSVTIPNGVTRIGNYAFSLCYDLEKAAIPGSVTSMGEGAFGYCSNLKEITIPDDLTHIGIDAFYECNQLPPILFSVGGKTLVRYSEANTASQYSIPAGVTSIADAAFAYCESLKSVTIPENVAYVGRHAFLHCTRLAHISIPDTITRFGFDAFYGCDQLPPILFSVGGKILFRYLETITAAGYSIPEGVVTIADGAFSFCENLVSVTLPESLSRIGGHAFWYCTGLTEITFPESVASLEVMAFYGCGNLRSAYFQGDAPELGVNVFNSDPVLYYTAGASGWTTPTWNGYRTEVWGPGEPPALSFEVKAGKLILTYSGGSLQASGDLILWSPVEGAQEGKYEVNLPKTGNLFYRIAQ